MANNNNNTTSNNNTNNKPTTTTTTTTTATTTSITNTTATMDRRSSVGNAVFNNLFRTNTMTSPAAAAPGTSPISARRLSATLGLNSTVPPVPPSAPLRRSSTFSSLDESAIEDDEAGSPVMGRSPPASVFGSRRTSFAMHGKTLSGMDDSDKNAQNSISTNTDTDKNSKKKKVTTGQAKSALTDAFENDNNSSYLTSAVRRLSLSSTSRPSTSSLQQPSSATAEPSSSLSNTPAHPISATAAPKSISNFSSSLPRTDASSFTWSDQLRSRAEGRSSFLSGSPPRIAGFSPVSTSMAQHRRESSASEAMPPVSAPAPMGQQEVPVLPTPKPKARRKPDAFQERILKGDFYMD